MGLYLEGAAEDMITSSLEKLKASPEEIDIFLQKENGKLLFKPEHVQVLYTMCRENRQIFSPSDETTLIFQKLQ